MLLGECAFMDADWVRWMWVALYVYQLVLTFYVITVICRPHDVSKMLRSCISPTSLLVYILGLGSLVAWTILRDRSGPGAFLIVLTLFGACVFIIIVYSIIIQELAERKLALLAHCKCDVITTSVLVINGLAAMATWTMILSVYDVSQTLFLYKLMSSTGVRYLWLGVVIGFIIIFFLVEVLFTASAMEYTVTPFMVTALAYVSVIMNNPAGSDVMDDAVRYATYAGIVVSLVLMFAALGVGVYKGRRLKSSHGNRGDLVQLTPYNTDSPDHLCGKPWLNDQ
jgi:hypothetical protein